MLPRLKQDLVPLVLRLALATIFISHGYFKLHAGHGSEWEPKLNPNVALAVAWGEFIGGCALLVGLGSRLAALGLGVIQVGAIALVTGQRDFIHDLITTSRQRGFTFTSVGYEYNFALLAMCFSVIVLGSGLFSIDHCLYRRWRARSAMPAGAVPAGS